MTDSKLIDIYNKTMGIWAIILVICSIIFNSIVFIVCLKSNELRSISTFKLLAVAAINDALQGFSWNLGDFTWLFFDFNLDVSSLFYCKFLATFMINTTCCFASWLLVSISLDRVLSLYIRSWSNKYFNGQRPFFLAAFILLVIMSIFGWPAIKSGYSYTNENGSEIIVCFEGAPGDTYLFDIITLVRNYYYF
jgi:hypothetical protein